MGVEQNLLGRVLDDQKPEDQSLMFLASAMSNVSIRWQQGKFVGAGAFGSVYTAINLDTGSVMAVKEIRVQDVSGSPNLYKQIQDELKVMEMLHHPNIVEYYGIEVHRDKVYIFEEYCEGGSLAANLEVGRIADENILQIYSLQMLQGLSYLHSQNIVHRDIKPDSEFSYSLPDLTLSSRPPRHSPGPHGCLEICRLRCGQSYCEEYSNDTALQGRWRDGEWRWSGHS